VKYQFTLVAAVAAVLGGWLIVMPGAVLTLALRVGEFGEVTNTTDYSVILALGWLALIVSLIAIGKLSDALLKRYSTRRYLLLIAMPLLVVAALILMTASTPEALGAGWILIQLPAAAIIATALATAGDSMPLGMRGIASGFIGAAPLLALLLGTALIRILQSDINLALFFLPVIGLLLTIPLSVMRVSPPQPLTPEISSSPPTATRVPGRWWISTWLAFLVADFLLSWATSTANSYVTLFVEFNSALLASDVASSATFLVLIATLTAIAGSVVGGLLSKSRSQSAVVFGSATAVVGIAITIIVLFPNPWGLTIGALFLGMGFGFANGAEFAFALSVNDSSEILGRNLGTLTATTSVPYVLVPALATFLLQDSPATGLSILFAGAAIAAFVGAAIALSLRTDRLRSSTRQR
jgi:MFS family permease